MRAKHLFRDHCGATAIEYAIVAGLIGLGLVGSLVSTRGSLSSIFGTTGSQMASSTGADPGSGAAASYQGPGFQRAPNWTAKTLVSGYPQTQTSPGKSVKTYQYTDGSSVFYTYFSDSSKLNVIEVKDAVAKTYGQMEIDDTGGSVIYKFTNYHDTLGGKVSNYTQMYGYNYGEPPTMTVQSTSYNTSNQATGSYYGAAQGADLAYISATYYDMRYFSGRNLTR